MDPITDYANGISFDGYSGPDRAAWIEGWIGAMLDELAAEFPNLGWTVVYDEVTIVSVELDVPAEDADRFQYLAYLAGIMDNDAPVMRGNVAIFSLILCNV